VAGDASPTRTCRGHYVKPSGVVSDVMTRTQLLSIALALLLVLAGCTGADAPSDATPVAGGGDGGADDPDDFDVSDPETVLRDAGSFTSTWRFTVTDADGETTTMSNSFAVNIAENRTSEAFSVVGESVTNYERYVADGTSYTRFGEDEEAFYQVTPFQGDPISFALARGAAFAYDDLSDAEAVGTESFDGVSVTRYEYRDPLLWQQYGTSAFAGEENVTVTDFVLVSLVDDDGLARSTGWTLTGENEAGEEVRAEWRFELTDVGSTTVPDPDWLEEAESRSDTGVEY
jgi:hypothetical protein